MRQPARTAIEKSRPKRPAGWFSPVGLALWGLEMEESGKKIDLDRLEAHIRKMRCKAVAPFKTGNTKSIYGEGYTDRRAAQDVALIVGNHRSKQADVDAFYTPRRQATEDGRKECRERIKKSRGIFEKRQRYRKTLLEKLEQEKDTTKFCRLVERFKRNDRLAECCRQRIETDTRVLRFLNKEEPNRDMRAIREAADTLLAAIKNAGYVARGEIQKRMQHHFGYRAAIMPDPAAALVEYLHGLAACAQEVGGDKGRPVAIDQESADKDIPPAKALAQELVTLLRGHIGRVPQRKEMVKLAEIVGEKLGWAGEAIQAAHKELWPTEFKRWFRQEGIAPDKVPEAEREADLEKAVRAICLLDGGPRTREESKNTYPPKEEIDKVRGTFWPPPKG